MSGPICLLLRLDRFKSESCPQMCQSRTCSFFHTAGDFRRNPRASPYSKILCPRIAACGEKDCRYAHNVAEQIFHPENYKKKYCVGRAGKKDCAFGDLCAYAHSDLELKVLPLHLLPINREFLLFYFKSEFCPLKTDHDKFGCVYAHNWQDFKRPYFNGQQAQNCPLWPKDDKLENYSSGCAKGFACDKCHGWKELEYHPARLRALYCQVSPCPRKLVCGFRHQQDEFGPLGNDKFFFPARKALNYRQHSLLDYFKYVEVPEVSQFENEAKCPKTCSSLKSLRNTESLDDHSCFSDAVSACKSIKPAFSFRSTEDNRRKVKAAKEALSKEENR